MTATAATTDTAGASGPPVAPVACDTCGHDADVILDERGWCASCLHTCGSCCADPVEAD